MRLCTVVGYSRENGLKVHMKHHRNDIPWIFGGCDCEFSVLLFVFMKYYQHKWHCRHSDHLAYLYGFMGDINVLIAVIT